MNPKIVFFLLCAVTVLITTVTVCTLIPVTKTDENDRETFSDRLYAQDWEVKDLLIVLTNIICILCVISYAVSKIQGVLYVNGLTISAWVICFFCPIFTKATYDFVTNPPDKK